MGLSKVGPDDSDENDSLNANIKVKHDANGLPRCVDNSNRFHLLARN